MATIVYATDIHLTDKQPVNREDSVYPLCLDKLSRILELARSMDKVLVLGGDLFDMPCPSYDLLAATINLFDCFRDVKTYLIRGNHDLKFLNDFEETGVSVLHAARLITILENPITIKGFRIIPVPYSTELPIQHSKYKEDSSITPRYNFFAGHYEELSVPKDDTDPRGLIPVTSVLVAHMPIVSEPVPYSHILCKNIDTDVDFLLCGHIHAKFDVTIPQALHNDVQSGMCHVLNPGCVTRLKRNEESIVPSALILTGEYPTVSYKFVPLNIPNSIKFKQEEKGIVDFKPAMEEKKIDIDDVTAYIQSSKYCTEVKNKALDLVKEKQEELV